MITPPSLGFVYVLAMIAAALGVALARVRAEHKPVAVFLVVSIVVDLLRFYLRGAFHLDVPGPYVGTQRVAFHVEELGFLVWPTGLIALALVVFAGRRAWPAFVAWAATGAGLIALYPSELVRRAGLQRIYLAANLVTIVVLIASVASWGRKRVAPSSEHAVIFVLGALEFARLGFYYGWVDERWAAYGAPTHVVLYGLVAAIQGGFLWSLSSRRG